MKVSAVMSKNAPRTQLVHTVHYGFWKKINLANDAKIWHALLGWCHVLRDFEGVILWSLVPRMILVFRN